MYVIAWLKVLDYISYTHIKYFELILFPKENLSASNILYFQEKENVFENFFEKENV